ncbi:hypothetical protein shim_20110 [Shimia sp. SK013]|uniref:hypothetical protein n=1 Tax=Shimia sp. SK013 TaxID=1389006 RepID=UPI0006CD7428|nr:hypothetical protein [Shimia sp. SK013]KPA21309.1 hypothetical protein shim_20110 [Shimia sp. SK013]
MPDPVSNAEIEDVLTSIRRLVSENRQVPTESVSEGEHPENSAPNSDEPVKNAPMALVLTPALRVSDAVADEDEDVFVEDSSDGAAELFVSDIGDSDIEALDLAGHAVEIPEDELFSEGDELENRPDDVVADAEELQIENASELADESEDPAEQAWDVEFSEDALEAAEITEDVDGEFSASGTITPEAVSEAMDSADFDEPSYLEETAAVEETSDVSEVSLTLEGGADEVMDSRLESVDEEAGLDDVDEPQDDVRDEPFDFKKVLEARLVHWRDGDGSEVEADPAEPVDSDYTDAEASTPAWGTDEDPIETLDAPSAAEVIEAVAIEQAAEDVADAVDVGLSEALDEPAVIDEEALREMVADIVRQELQGALGERITRNVRKLVRREIHRALAAHELD